MSRQLVRVAGSCPAGHALERDAELDGYGRPRLTWRGPCPTDGCAAYLVARRIKNHQRTAAPASEPTPTPTTPAPAARRAVRKVTAYRDAPSRPAPKRRPDRKPADVSSAPVPAVAPAAAVVDQRPGDGSELEQPTGRRHRRFSFGGPDARDADGFTIPGIY